MKSVSSFGGKAAQHSVHFCVGIVQQPMRGIWQGESAWACQLLVSQCGAAADRGVAHSIQSQERYALQCRGSLLTTFCVQHLREGDVVHVASRLIQRPKYIPIHECYFNETELLVTDSFGFISKIKTLYRP